MATVWRMQGESGVITPKNGTDFSLEELQDYVEGYIEVLTLPDDESIMVVNEEALLEALPLNDLATKLYGSPIHGNVVVCAKSEMR